MNHQIQQNRNAPIDVILTREEAAKHIKVSVRTIDEWRNKRLIPAIQIGRSVRFSMRALDACLTRSTVQATTAKRMETKNEAN